MLNLNCTEIYEKNSNSEAKIIINRGGTRCHSKNTKIRMFDGKLKNVQDIVVGDKIASQDGLSFNVVDEIHSGITDMYLIEQGKGISYNVTADHILCLKQNSPKPYKKVLEKKPYGFGCKPTVFYDRTYDKELIHYFTARQWSKVSGKIKKRFSGFKNTFLELPKKINKIDSYYLGLWLGDGNSNQGYTITTADDEIVNYLTEFSEFNGLVLEVENYRHSMRHPVFNKQSDLSKLFWDAKLINNKHIPEDYIYTSYEDRLKLLAGLIDSDGYQTGRHTLSITQKNKKIIEGIKEILDISGFYSTGIRQETSKMKRKDGSIYQCEVYTIEFNHPNFKDLNKYLKIDRKKIVKEGNKTFNIFQTKLKSTYAGKEEYYGFSLAGEDKLYKLEDGTITHNSSKTYSLLQLLIVKSLTEKNKRIIICRKTLPSLRRTILKDFNDILASYDLNKYYKKNMSTLTWTCKVTGTTIEFTSLDDEEKVRGLSANYFYFNEASEIEEIFFTQAILRLTVPSGDDKKNQFFIDFNPSSSSSWIKKLEETRKDDVEVIVSTYSDNPFLAPEAVREIEELKLKDYDLWLIYGEGKYGDLMGQVFKNWQTFNYKNPPDTSGLPIYYGMDFGFSNDFTSLVECALDKENKRMYLWERLFAKGLTNIEIDRLLSTRIDKTSSKIVADSSEPKSIAELKSLGWRNIEGAVKGPDSIKNGIDIMLRYEIYIASNALNIIDEFSNYTWKIDKQGTPLNIPKDSYNHSVDATRYIVSTWGNIRGTGKIYVR